MCVCVCVCVSTLKIKAVRGHYHFLDTDFKIYLLSMCPTSVSTFFKDEANSVSA